MSSEADDALSWRRRGARHPDDPFFSRRRPDRPAHELTLAERVRIARTAGRPQAVVRVMAYRRGRDAVWRTLTYVAAKASYEVTIEGGQTLSGRSSLADVLDDWARDFSTRANGRDVVHIEMSAPPGSDRDGVARAARSFVEATFGADHQFVLVDHRDTGHPHAHLVLKLQRHDGSRLDPRKSDLARWRAGFAAAARANGIEMEASTRAARGILARRPPQAIVKLRARGEMPLTDELRLTAAAAGAGATAAESAARDHVVGERKAYRDAADRLRRAAGRSANGDERKMLLVMARDLATFVAGLPGVASERERLAEILDRSCHGLTEADRDVGL